MCQCRAMTDLGSSGPHQTPMPAIDPGFPFPLHAPSLYTTSRSELVVVEVEARLLLVSREGPASALVLPSEATAPTEGSTPRTKSSASALVANFLYLAFG